MQNLVPHIQHACFLQKNSEEKCAICLEEYQAKVLVRQLVCK